MEDLKNNIFYAIFQVRGGSSNSNVLSKKCGAQKVAGWALFGIFNLQQFFYWNLEALSFALFIFASTFTHEAVSSTGDISLFTDIHTSKRWTLRPHIHKIFESLRYGSFHQLTFLQWLWHSLSSLRNTFVADRQQ